MTHEIRELRARWQSRRQALLRADYNHADEELARALHFCDHTPIIASIIQDIRSHPTYQAFDAHQWLTSRSHAGTLGAGRTNLGFSLDDRERAAQCLKVLELAKSMFDSDQDGLLQIGFTTYGGGSTKLIDSIHSAIETVFDPFYEHIDAELRTRECMITPTDIITEIQNLVDTQTGLKYPQTHQLLADAYRLLFSLTAASSGASWYQLGYSCRTVLVRFANEVFERSYVAEGQDQPKEDDAQNKLKWTARYHLRRVGVGDRYREGVEAVIKANWDFVNNVGHRQESVSEHDARLALIYTYLTINLIDHIIER